MIITWFGEGCFKIQSGEKTVSVDPLEKGCGLNVPRFKADFILKTIQDLPVEFRRDEVLVICGPGEYEVNGIEIFGKVFAKEARAGQLKTAYFLKIDDMKLVFLGQLSCVPEMKELEEFMDCDILFVPAGGGLFINQKDAAHLIRQLKPKIVIPSFFKISGLKRKADDVKLFLKEIEQSPEFQDKLVIKKKDLPQNMKVVLLKI